MLDNSISLCEDDLVRNYLIEKGVLNKPPQAKCESGMAFTIDLVNCLVYELFHQVKEIQKFVVQEIIYYYNNQPKTHYSIERMHQLLQDSYTKIR